MFQASGSHFKNLVHTEILVSELIRDHFHLGEVRVAKRQWLISCGKWYYTGVFSVTSMQFAIGKLEASICYMSNIEELMTRHCISAIVMRAIFHSKSSFSSIENTL